MLHKSSHTRLTWLRSSYSDYKGYAYNLYISRDGAGYILFFYPPVVIV